MAHGVVGCRPCVRGSSRRSGRLLLVRRSCRYIPHMAGKGRDQVLVEAHTLVLGGARQCPMQALRKTERHAAAELILRAGGKRKQPAGFSKHSCSGLNGVDGQIIRFRADSAYSRTSGSSLTRASNSDSPSNTHSRTVMLYAYGFGRSVTSDLRAASASRPRERQASTACSPRIPA